MHLIPNSTTLHMWEPFEPYQHDQHQLNGQQQQASSRDKGGPGTSATAGLTAARTMLLMYKSSLTMDRGDFALVASANFVDAQTELLLR
ncbi:hypothetical protein ABBQ38_014644, partial [Trebouxia sp. C0009 RCD-2024]